MATFKSVRNRFVLLTGLFGLAISSFLLLSSHLANREISRNILSNNTALAMEFDLALRDYVKAEIRPRFQELVGKDEFIPETMSTSYVAREVFDRVRKNNPDYILKFSSTNPRNPANAAGPEEQRIIDYLNTHPDVKEWQGEITLNDTTYLARFHARRMQSDCRQCHGHPQDAPASLVARYGDKAGFHQPAGEVVATDTVALPLHSTNQAIAAEFQLQLLITLGAFAILLGGIVWLFRRLIAQRLERVTRHFRQYATDDHHQSLVPLEINGDDEISQLALGFNALAKRLEENQQLLEQRVQERTHDLEVLIENNPCGIMLVDAQTRQIVKVNENACKISGYDKDELIGKICTTCLCPAQKNSCPILDMGQTLEVSERKLVHKNGRHIPILKSVVQIMHQNRPHLLETFIDISASKRIEQEKMEHLERDRRQKQAMVQLVNAIGDRSLSARDIYQRITTIAGQTLETNRCSIWLFTQGQRMLQCVDLYESGPERHEDNMVLDIDECPAYYEALGRERALAIHDALADARTREFSDNYIKPLHIQSMLDAPIRLAGETVGVICFEHSDTPRRWTGDEASFAAEVADQIAHFLLSQQQHHAEENLQASEELLFATLESTGDGILVVDEGGKIMHYNQQFIRMWRIPEEILVRDEAALLDYVQDQLTDSETFRAKTRELHQCSQKTSDHLYFKDGRIYDRQSHPLVRSERVVGRVWNFRDITERSQLEHQLQQAQKMESIGRLASGIAHEINTPAQFVGDNTLFVRESFDDLLTIIDKQQHLLDDLLAGKKSEEQIGELKSLCEQSDLNFLLEEIPRAIEQTLEGVDRVATIARAMKEFAHPGSMEKGPVDLNKSIQSTITVARNEWKYVADLNTDFDPALGLVNCHVGEINQVILNLIINSVHAIKEKLPENSPDKGLITISTRQKDNHVEIRVSDTGTGIAPEHQSRVFDPFFTTKKVGVGSGQGLALARSVIVDHHGGSIDLESQMGIGATFILRLPTSPLDDPMDELKSMNVG